MKYKINYINSSKGGASLNVLEQPAVMYRVPLYQALPLSHHYQEKNKEVIQAIAKENTDAIAHNVKNLLDIFQEKFLLNYFIYTLEESYMCKAKNNYFNIEWILHDTINFNSIIRNDPFFDITCRAINNICFVSSNSDFTNYIYNDFESENSIVGNGPHQTHIHASYSLPYINENNYYLVIGTFAKIWVEKFQITFIKEFIGEENFIEWADESQKACGKPLIFSELIKEGENDYIYVLGTRYFIQSFYSGKKYIENFFNFTNYGLTEFHIKNKTYLTNIIFEKGRFQIPTDSRYIDLNLEPIKHVGDGVMELHVEFRALINFVETGGGVNNFILNKYSASEHVDSIKVYLARFARRVEQFFRECTNTIYQNNLFTPDHLRFGIEIETCVNTEKIKTFIN